MPEHPSPADAREGDDLRHAHVEPGGPAAVHRLGRVTVRKASVSEQDNNAYLLTADDGGQVLVDAADDATRLLALVAEGSGRLDAVVTTHRHWDHHRALPAVVEATGAAVLAGAEDAAELPVPVTRPLAHGDVVTAGGVRLEVIGLRGHTPGSVALVLREEEDAPRPGRVHLFTGDSLFPGGVGRTWAPGDFTTLLDDVEARVFARFPDDARVYPGHGDDTTLGRERPHLAEWRSRGW
ncbi:MBL fold metallo-hydrolase [Georgenia sp. EYE_87]|uniref:MBL fold metallo-hydrolase n=1 Tax=Georgenia sp. EYE_87 TaxID=2853448 RepID=UPI0020030838|nr:MBL fold metallo-hydrolase [Georgenia sp. EYE_87]MCK6209050.1 MBL fold metallo-hydrolase [Georgenia sp. EYE_87]